MSTSLTPTATTNGNGSSAPVRPDRGVVGPQMSASGTWTGADGTTYPDEAVAKLADPQLRMEAFDEMRKSDECVAAACDIREQMVRSANWDLSPPDDTPRMREITDFVEDNVFPVLPRALVQLAGGRVQFGFAGLERVLAWSDESFARNVSRGKVRRAARRFGRRMLYLRKLAHFRQRTVTTFLVYPDGPNKGDLRAVRQYATNAGAFRWGTVDVPADRLLVTTYNQSGDDYWGNPPMRSAYRAWYIKQQLEKLNALNIDRFGVGTPVIEGGEGWTQPDFDTAFQFAQLWRSGGNTALGFRKGGKVTIVTGDGSMVTSIGELAKYYGVSIQILFQTQQSQLSLNSDAGARSLGESFVQQLEGAVQADCEEIAELLNERLIVPLVRYNFGDQDAYPAFTPSQRVRATATLASTLAAYKAAGFLTPDARDEVFVRDAHGLPAKTVQQIEAARDDRAARAALISGGGNDDGQPQGDGDEAPAGDDADPDEDAGPPPTGPRRIAASQAGAGHHRAARAAAPGHRADPTPAGARRSGAGGGAAGGDVPRRDGGGPRAHGLPPRALASRSEPATDPTRRGLTAEWLAWEEKVGRFAQTARDLDAQAARAEDEVQDVLRAMDEDLAGDVERVQGTGSLAALADLSDDIAVSPALVTRLSDALYEVADRAYAYGENSVASELARQRGADPVEPARAPGVATLSARTLAASGRAVQSVIFPKKHWESREDCAKWLKAHDFKTYTSRETESSYRFRQRPPGDFDQGSFRNTCLAKSGGDCRVSAVVGQLKGDAKEQRRQAGALTTLWRGAVRFAVGGSDDDPDPPTSDALRAAALKAAVVAAAKAEASRRENQTRDAIARALADGGIAAAAATVLAGLRALSRPRTAQAAGDVVNTGFGAGRAAGAAAALDRGEPVVAAVYSAVMDPGTCDACAALDGGEYPPDQPTRTGPGEVKCPNPRCAGGRSCRCVWVMVLGDEAASADGPTAPAPLGPGRGAPRPRAVPA